MKYKRLGCSGLQVSELSVGSWVTYANQVNVKQAKEMLAFAMDQGVNFFDNAEAYANGKSEEVMGDAIKALKWPRLNYIVSTKFFWGLGKHASDSPSVNRNNTLNRKYLMQAIDGSLKRMGLDFIDLVYCHRPDPHTPIEETVFAMSDMITQGKALYWGTSEWSADEIRAAWCFADKHHLHKPVMEQPQYNLFHRKRVEHEYTRLYQDIGLGLTTWSPLASGLLTGKYVDGVPKNSRGSRKELNFLVNGLTDTSKNAAVTLLSEVAANLDCTVGQLAIAWASHNPYVSTVITGASTIEQLRDNLKATEVTDRLSPDVMAQIDKRTLQLAD